MGEDVAIQRAELQAALVNFDGLKVDAIIQQGNVNIGNFYIDPHKYHNALHELVLNYIAYIPQDRPAKLHIKFIDILRVLTQNGLDVNDVDVKLMTPLHHCVTSPDHPEIIRALLATGARVNQPDSGLQTALHKAVLTGSKVDVTALLEGAADPNLMDNMGHSSLHVAVRKHNNMEILKLLVGCGGNINLNHPEWSKTTRGSTPLHAAARLGRVDNGCLLVSLGADPNILDSAGQTALHVAACHDITGVLCRKLLENGAKIEAVDCISGETALHKAVKSNMEANVLALLSHQASVAATDINGCTVIHKAATYCRDPSIWRILSGLVGIKVDAADSQGQTAIDRAVKAKNSLAAIVLKGYNSSQTSL